MIESTWVYKRRFQVDIRDISENTKDSSRKCARIDVTKEQVAILIKPGCGT